MLKTKETLIAAAIALSSSIANAANYNIILYNKDKVSAPAYTISLQDYVFPTLRPGVGQSFDVSTLATVLGDPAYNASNLTWGTQSLPAGFSVEGNFLKGSTTTVGDTSFMLTANYKGVSSTKQYILKVAGAPVLGDIVSSSYGYMHGCAITGNGNTYCWGYNNTNVVLGVGSIVTTYKTPKPQIVTTGEPMKQISTSGTYSTCAVSQAGNVFCWGHNVAGQVTGLGSTTPIKKESPTKIPGISNAVNVGVSTTHACAALSNGGVACWGKNNNGQFGNNAASTAAEVVTNMDTSMFVAGEGAVEVAVMDNATCVRTNQGRVLCTGYAQSGETGQGNTVERRTLAPVLGMSSGVQKLVVGYYSACAIKTGELYCWGYGASVNAGAIVTVNPTPVLQSGLTNVTEVGMFNMGTICAVSNGNAYCWGDNQTVMNLFPAAPNVSPSPGNLLSSNVGPNFKFPTFVGSNAICYAPNGNLKCGVVPGMNLGAMRGMLGDGTYVDKTLSTAAFVIAP